MFKAKITSAEYGVARPPKIGVLFVPDTPATVAEIPHEYGPACGTGQDEFITHVRADLSNLKKDAALCEALKPLMASGDLIDELPAAA